MRIYKSAYNNNVVKTRPDNWYLLVHFLLYFYVDYIQFIAVLSRRHTIFCVVIECREKGSLLSLLRRWSITSGLQRVKTFFTFSTLIDKIKRNRIDLMIVILMCRMLHKKHIVSNQKFDQLVVVAKYFVRISREF